MNRAAMDGGWEQSRQDTDDMMLPLRHLQFH